MTEQARADVAVVSAAILGLALITHVQWVGVSLLIPALALAAMATLGRRELPGLESPGDGRVHQIAFWLGIFLFSRSLLRALDVSIPSQAILLVFGAGVVGGAAFAVIVQRREHLAFAVFLGGYLIVALGVLAATSDPPSYIDVVVFQQDASGALAEGTNPYDMTFPDRYSPEESDLYYGPGVSEDGVLQFGYPYLPLSLLVVAPFELVFGDFRIAHVLAIVGTAFIMSRIRPGHGARSIAILFLLTSPVFHIVIFGWIEPLLIVCTALVVLAASRHSKTTSYLTGALLSLKQYAVLMLPVSLLLLKRPFQAREVLRHVAQAGAVVAATTLPFLLWNPERFIWSAVELQFVQPFRHDSLSFMAAWAAVAGEPARLVTSLLPLLFVAGASVMALSRTPTGAQGFSLAAGLVCFVAFAFSKQAFSNYYILVMALLFLGAAAGQPGQSDSPAAAVGDAEARDTGPWASSTP